MSTAMPASNESRHLILGFPRSGTTLLSRLLDAHDEISSPPETGMFTAAARFLKEQTAVEGPPIGVLSGLGFCGLEPEDVYAPLREMLFGFQARIASGKPRWVEKTATDIFHLETLEPFLSGHARFICITRNMLDVVASNLDLMNVMGAQLAELFELTRGVNGPLEGLARALVDRTDALDSFCARHPVDALHIRYEDLLDSPTETLGKVFAFIGVGGDPDAVVARAFARQPRVGLGDFRIHETAGIRRATKDGWRKRLPRAGAARILPLLAPLLERHGYAVPRLPRVPSRSEALRQFTLATAMKRSASAAAGTAATAPPAESDR